MALYTVTCSNPQTAADYAVEVRAATPREAIAQLAENGHITGAIRLKDGPGHSALEGPSAPADPLLLELKALNNALSGLRVDVLELRKLNILRIPTRIIASGIVLALLIYLVLAALGLLVLFGLAGGTLAQFMPAEPARPALSAPGR